MSNKWTEFVTNLFMSEETPPETSKDESKDTLELSDDNTQEVVEEPVEETIELESNLESGLPGDKVEVPSKPEAIIKGDTPEEYVTKSELESAVKEIVQGIFKQLQEFKSEEENAIAMSAETNQKLEERIIALEEELKAPSKSVEKVIPQQKQTKVEHFNMVKAIEELNR